jgi:predicted DNA-binding transcriptional regulator AlpA
VGALMPTGTTSPENAPSMSSQLGGADTLLTRREVAEYLRVSVATLERWARLGVGPRPHRIGPNTVRYRLSTLLGRMPSEGTPRPKTRSAAQTEPLSGA